MALITFEDDRSQQSVYLLSLADEAGVPHSDIVNTRDGWRVPQSVADLYVEGDVEGYVGGGDIVVINAGTDLAASRKNAACAYWKFAAGVVPGDAGENIVNGRKGDLVFVASA